MKYDYRILDETESTSLICKKAAQEGHAEGYVVHAYRQTAGYGRRGSAWASPDGGLYFSLLLKPNVSPEQLPTIMQAMAVALRRAAVALGRTGAQIKAPNDIVLGKDEHGNMKKLAGIVAEKQGDSVVIGIGMNVVHFGRPLPAAGGNVPAYILEKPFNQESRMRVDMARDIVLNCISDIYAVWHDEGFEPFKEEYQRALYQD